MISNKKILYIIPARGGSKGIPRKNIINLAGKPLIAYTIESAKRSRYGDAVIVSTDNKEIADISKTYGAEVPFLRPKKYATDSSPSSDAILHAIRWFEKKKNYFDVVVLLEPTSPLRKDDDIDKAIETFVDHYSEADTLVSVGEVQLENPFIMKVIDKGYVKPLIASQKTFTQRQELPKAYFPYGVIYMSRVETYKKTKTFYQERILPYYIERWQNYEIDDLCDFSCVEAVMAQRNQLSEKNKPKISTLEGTKTFMKPFLKEHLYDKRYYAWLGDMEVVKTIGRSEYLEKVPFSEVESYVRKLWESDHDYFFALYLKKTKEFIGTVKIASIDWFNKTAGIGIMIGERRHWGKGLARDSLTAVCRYCFEQLHLRKLTGGCLLTNTAMMKCFERLGFVKEGVQRRQNFLDKTYVDHVLYGLFEKEFKKL